MCTKYNFDVSKVLNHTHQVSIAVEDTQNPPLAGRNFLLKTALGHSHVFHLNQVQLLELQAGKKVVVDSTDNGVAPSGFTPLLAQHHHQITVTCVKTHFYQEVWFWVLIILVVIAFIFFRKHEKKSKQIEMNTF